MPTGASAGDYIPVEPGESVVIVWPDALGSPYIIARLADVAATLSTRGSAAVRATVESASRAHLGVRAVLACSGGARFESQASAVFASTRRHVNHIWRARFSRDGTAVGTPRRRYGGAPYATFPLFASDGCNDAIGWTMVSDAVPSAASVRLHVRAAASGEEALAMVRGGRHLGDRPYFPVHVEDAAAVFEDTGGLLDERAPVLGPRFQDRRQAPLADDDVHLTADAGVRQQFLHVHQPARTAVDLVLTGAVAEHAPRDGHLGVVDGQRTVGVVDGQRHLGPAERGPPGGTGEDDVLHLAAAQRLGALLTHHPGQRVDDVRFA
mgnify:CR=1 FL=1